VSGFDKEDITESSKVCVRPYVILMTWKIQQIDMNAIDITIVITCPEYKTNYV
jgi:hypothetical protein